MFRFNPKKSLYYLILITLILWSVMGFLTYNFVLRDIKNLSKEIRDKRVELARLDYNARNYDIFASDYQEVSKDIPRLEKVISEEGEVIVFIRKLEEIAEEVGISQDIEMRNQTQEEEPQGNKKKKEEEKETKEEFKPLVYQVTLEGNFNGIVKYIQALESLDYCTNINSINLYLAHSEEEVRDLVRSAIEAELYVE